MGCAADLPSGILQFSTNGVWIEPETFTGVQCAWASVHHDHDDDDDDDDHDDDDDDVDDDDDGDDDDDDVDDDDDDDDVVDDDDDDVDGDGDDGDGDGHREDSHIHDRLMTFFWAFGMAIRHGCDSLRCCPPVALVKFRCCDIQIFNQCFV